MSKRVAIVTGSNKGIGLAIVKGLCKRFDGVVYLTSRDTARGLTALAQLQKEGFNADYHQLDVADRKSVEVFRDHIKQKHGGIDVLINNAAVANAGDLHSVDYDSCKEIIDINYKSLLTIEELLFPLLRDGARVVNMSSDCGHLSNVRNKRWIDRFTKKDFRVDDINEFVDWYLESVKGGTFDRDDIADGGSVAAYRVSKVAMSALTILQQRALAARGVCVNSMHPGLVRTSMTLGVGFYSPEEAAETPLYLALAAPPDVKGQYVWHDKRMLDWYDYEADYFFKCKTLNA